MPAPRPINDRVLDKLEAASSAEKRGTCGRCGRVMIANHSGRCRSCRGGAADAAPARREPSVAPALTPILEPETGPKGWRRENLADWRRKEGEARAPDPGA